MGGAITLVPIVLAQIALLAGGPVNANHDGAMSVRGVIANEQAAQNSGNWRSFYRQFDPIVRRGGCSYKVFYRFWHGDAVKVGLTGRDGGRVWYSNIHVWTDEGGSYAFASYDFHIGHRFIGHVAAGEDSFIRRTDRWYDRFENGDYARGCLP